MGVRKGITIGKPLVVGELSLKSLLALTSRGRSLRPRRPAAPQAVPDKAKQLRSETGGPGLPSATTAGKLWEAARRCLDAASYEALRQQDDAERIKAEAGPESLVRCSPASRAALLNYMNPKKNTHNIYI